MIQRLIFSALLLLFISFSGCSNKEDLELSGGIDLEAVAASETLSPRERANSMMEALNSLIRVVAKEKDDKKAAATLDAYLEAHSEQLNKITQDFGDWSLKASQEDLMGYIGDLQSKPYYAELDSNLTLVGYRMAESPELEKSMSKLLALINPPS
jgi:hypothetical protein